MDIHRLVVFCKVIDLQSFTKAAEAVNLTQPTVSEHISALEASLGEKLVERDGLYALREPPRGSPLEGVSPAGGPVRFMLTTEISSIYRKHGLVRKVHSLIGVPLLEHARRLGARLAAIGNVASDGRPILGLDPKDLLAILLDITPEGFLIPAHVWTPWFSLFGSKSGFDAIEECFEDLTPHIFAL